MKRKNNDEELKCIDDSSSESSDDCALDSDEADEVSESTADQNEINSNFDISVETQKPITEKVKEKVSQRYQERQGKQLYIRFPHKIPETQESLEEKVRNLTPLVIKVHKPRQKHVRFCLADFATKADRDAALNNLKKAVKNGDLNKYIFSIPRTESSDFVEELVKRKIKSIENKKAKLRLKRATKKSLMENNYTSTVIVLNLPQNVSLLQIRELFVNAVDINIKPGKDQIHKGKSTAAITFPTTLDARNAIKKNLSLDGNKLVIKFDNKKLGKITKKAQNISNIQRKNNDLKSQKELKAITKKAKTEANIHTREGQSFEQKSNKSERVRKNNVAKKSITKKVKADPNVHIREEGQTYELKSNKSKKVRKNNVAVKSITKKIKTNANLHPREEGGAYEQKSNKSKKVRKNNVPKKSRG